MHAGRLLATRSVHPDTVGGVEYVLLMLSAILHLLFFFFCLNRSIFQFKLQFHTEIISNLKMNVSLLRHRNEANQHPIIISMTLIISHVTMWRCMCQSIHIQVVGRGLCNQAVHVLPAQWDLPSNYTSTTKRVALGIEDDESSQWLWLCV